MILFYIDESGHHRMAPDDDDPSHLARDTTDWFVLSAVGIRDSERESTAEAVFALKERHLGADAERPWGETELKGRRLAITRRRLGGGRVDPEADYPALGDTRQLDELDDAIGAILADLDELTFTIAIDKHRLFERRPGVPALGSAYAFLYRRIALTLAERFPGEHGILIADQQTEHEKAFRDHELLRVRDELAAKGHLVADYRLLLDRPLWIDSTLSTWDREIIQLADLVAFTTHEGLARGFDSVAARELWPQIRPALATNADLNPDGEGFVIYPKPAVWPDTTAR